MVKRECNDAPLDPPPTTDDYMHPAGRGRRITLFGPNLTFSNLVKDIMLNRFNASLEAPPQIITCIVAS